MNCRFYLFAVLIFAVVHIAEPACDHNPAEGALAFSQFFDQMDNNNDGEVDESEAKKYIGERIGGEEFDSAPELAEAFNHMLSNIDKGGNGDKAHTISKDEVQKHLQRLRQVSSLISRAAYQIGVQSVSVKEWVCHGLGLPQYAEKFKENAITADDFPTLIRDADDILENDLKISSKLHRTQIKRGIYRLMLGLGELPSGPAVVDCRPLSESETTLQWDSPIQLGNPPIHKYLVESREVGGGGMWEVEAEIESRLEEKRHSAVINQSVAQRAFRVVAWTPFGSSEYVYFDDCTPMSIDNRSDLVRSNRRPASEKDQAFGVALLVVLMVGLTTVVYYRVHTQRRTLPWCCFLRGCEQRARKVGASRLGSFVSKILRKECTNCKANRNKSRKRLVDTQSKSDVGQKAPGQRFYLTSSYKRISKSSPGRLSGDYRIAQWDGGETSSGELPEYQTEAWDDSARTDSDNSVVNPKTVNPALIKGRCAFKGY